MPTTVWDGSTATPATTNELIYNQGGTGAVSRTVTNRLQESISVKDYGAVGDNVADDTAELQAAYAAAKLTSKKLFVPKGTYKFTAKLTWDGEVDIVGEGTENSILQKWGNFIGVEITGAGQEHRYSGFAVKSTAGQGDVSVGIKILQVARMKIDHVRSSGHGSHGFHFVQGAPGGEVGFFSQLFSSQNDGAGILVDNINTSTWIGCECIDNDGIGFDMTNADEHFIFNLNCELCRAGGLRIDGSLGNIVFCNIESCGSEAPGGAGNPVLTGGTSIGNRIIGRLGNSSTSLRDTGTNNAFWNYWTNDISVPFLQRHPTDNGIAGRDINIIGGTSKAGSSAASGGWVRITGGSAGGTGNASGGRVVIGGGAAIGTGEDGSVQLGPANDPASNELVFCTAPFRVWNLTTANRDLIPAPENGIIIYNTSTAKFQGRQAGAWVDLA